MHTHSASITEQILGPWLTVSEQGWGGRELHLELSLDVHLEDSCLLCWDSQRLTGSGSSWIDLEGNLFQFTDESVNTESVGKEDLLYCLFLQWSSVTLWNEHLEIPRREVLLRCRRAKIPTLVLVTGAAPEEDHLGLTLNPLVDISCLKQLSAHSFSLGDEFHPSGEEPELYYHFLNLHSTWASLLLHRSARQWCT